MLLQHARWQHCCQTQAKQRRVRNRSWLPTDLCADKPIMSYQYAQAQPQPPSYEQATHFHVPTPAQVVIIQQQPPPAVGPDPCYISCPHCHVQKLTRVEYSPSVRTHCMAALLCIVGLWCFACLPYCATSCMNANHFCGNCNKFVGVYSSD